MKRLEIDDSIIILTDERIAYIKGISRVIFDMLQNFTEDEVAKIVSETFSVDIDTVKDDIKKFLREVKKLKRK